MKTFERKSVSVSKEFDELAKKHHLSWSRAARMGMSILLAEEGEWQYDNDLNLYRKMKVYQEQAMKAMAELTKLKEKGKLGTD
jgi:hypothetical protein